MIKNLGIKAGANGFDKNPENAKKGGAPKGKRITTIISELLDNDISNFRSDLTGMNVNEAIAVELIAMAFHKDNTPKDKLAAIKEILDRIEGKAKQTIETKDTTITVQPLEFKVIR